MKTITILFGFILSLAACQTVIETNNSVILVPSANKTGPTIIVIGLNGAFCPPSIYVSLFQSIQNHSNYSIWVGMPKFKNNMPIMLDPSVPNTLQEVRDQGANSSILFMVAHSLGASSAQDWLYKNSTGYKGLVLLGKFMRFKYQDPQINYPLPVLTIGGELDGLTKITRLSMSFNQMLKTPKEGHIHYPVAIIPGAYHSSYIDGYVPPVILTTDITPEVTNKEAWQVVAELVDAFIDAQLNLDSLDTNAGAKFLYNHVYNTTYNLMKPLLDAFAMEGNPYLYNYSLISTTKWVSEHIHDAMNVSNNSLPTSVNVSEIYELSQFYNTSPSAVYGNGTLDYQVYTHKKMTAVETDDIEAPANQSALWISVKYKSPKYIQQIAPADFLAVESQATQGSCKALNEKVINETLANIPNKTLARYQKWGLKLVAGDDIDYTDYAQWNASEANYTDHGEYLTFSSPRYHTNVTGSGDSLSGGNFYCKLLSPGKVAEWVYVDGLKKFDGASINATNDYAVPEDAAQGIPLP